MLLLLLLLPGGIAALGGGLLAAPPTKGAPFWDGLLGAPIGLLATPDGGGGGFDPEGLAGGGRAGTAWTKGFDCKGIKARSGTCKRRRLLSAC